MSRALASARIKGTRGGCGLVKGGQDHWARGARAAPFPGWGWKAGGRLLVRGVQESLACGPPPHSSPRLEGLGGTQTQTRASGVTWPASRGSRGLSQPRPALAQSPAQPPPQGGLGGGVGVLLHFQVFPALGQRSILTNQLLQAHTVWGGARPKAARPAPGCGCGSGPRLWVWKRPVGALQAVMGLPTRQPCPWLLLLVVLGWPQPCLSLGKWRSQEGCTPPDPRGWGTCWSDQTWGHPPTPTNRERQPQGQWALDPHACLHGPRAHPLHAADNLLGPGREGHGHHVLPGAAALCAGRALRCRRHRLAGGGLQQR